MFLMKVIYCIGVCCWYCCSILFVVVYFCWCVVVSLFTVKSSLNHCYIAILLLLYSVVYVLLSLSLCCCLEYISSSYFLLLLLPFPPCPLHSILTTLVGQQINLKQYDLHAVAGVLKVCGENKR